MTLFEKFIEENIERDIKSFETINNLYERYLIFCGFYQIEPVKINSFGRQLRKFNTGVKHKRMRNRVIESGRWGVKLLPCKY